MLASSHPFARRDIAILAGLVLLVHIAVNLFTPYGVHRDEFLYMAMGRHLQLWRMDFPPFIAIASELSRLFGDSLVAIRLLPAVAGGTLVWLSGRFAWLLGGSRAAQLLAALCVATSPLFLRPGAMLQPVVFDQLWWTLGALALVRLAKPMGASFDEPTLWLLLGAALGMGLLTKFSIALFAVGVTTAVLLSPLRRALATRWPWCAALIVVALGSPSIIGQVRLGWPVVGQLKELSDSQLARVTAGSFLAEQLLLGPAVLIAIAGLVALLLSGRLRAQRPLGIALVTPLLLLLLTHGKGYYLGPVYPALFGAGAAFLFPGDARAGRAGAGGSARLLLPVLTAVLVIGYGMLVAPFSLPILPPVLMARYAAAMGIGTETNEGGTLALPQDYADMLGWPAQSAAAARVAARLDPAERARLTMVGGNYGEAGALDFHGARLGLPPAVSPAGSYWFFGPGSQAGDPTIVVTARDARAGLERLFHEVVLAEEVRAGESRWMVEEERDVVVFLCRRPRTPLAQLWPSLSGRN